MRYVCPPLIRYSGTLLRAPYTKRLTTLPNFAHYWKQLENGIIFKSVFSVLRKHDFLVPYSRYTAETSCHFPFINWSLIYYNSCMVIGLLKGSFLADFKFLHTSHITGVSGSILKSFWMAVGQNYKIRLYKGIFVFKDERTGSIFFLYIFPHILSVFGPIYKIFVYNCTKLNFPLLWSSRFYLLWPSVIKYTIYK